jgi:hypothetical protein
MGVFQDPKISEERIEPQPGIKNLAPPYGAGSSHEINLAQAAKRRL